MILMIKLFSQEITLSFIPNQTNEIIDSVQVTNLNTNQMVSILGSETINLDKSTSSNNFLSGENVSLYPNPSINNATLRFSTKNNSETIIQIFNSSGQVIINKKQILSAGEHYYSVELPTSGMYIISVRTGNEVLCFKQVSNLNGEQRPALLYLGNNQSDIVTEDKQLKSVTSNKKINYSPGDYFMFTLFSQKNSTILVDIPIKSNIYRIPFYECEDKEGRNYKTVTIADQIWMAENLALLTSVNTKKDWSLTEPRYYVYDYDGSSVSEAKSTDYYKKYGVLYNWTAANDVCPAGWHLPTEKEWVKLLNYLGGEDNAGGKMKSVYGWLSPNTGATNSSGFSGLPAGYKKNYADYDSFNYDEKGETLNCWSSTTNPDARLSNYAWILVLRNERSSVFTCTSYKASGFSVRCLKD